MNIIEQLKQSNLTGRGGANFPVWLKWETVNKAKGAKKYIVCNGAESEPNNFKDEYILKNHSRGVIDGINIALNYLKATEAIIYLKPDYFKKFKKNLETLIKDSPIKLYKKTGGYLCGEESTLLNNIEGKALEPRLRPPFPTTHGLYGCPTLINNVETFYYVASIDKNKYRHTKFISIAGDTKNTGTFELPLDLTINGILKNTNNHPSFDFFVQIGGGASGVFLEQTELNQPIKGTGSIIIYNLKKTNIQKLIMSIIEYFNKENCDKCVPCREGVYRLTNLLKEKIIDENKIKKIFDSLENSSFCALGKSVPAPIKSLMKIKSHHANKN
ncbi:MAG: hypothetical protein NT091_00685 [Candidatus Falkowbacteria bacterium]|nr:hypothetical protein [Candidatus Falkowbacteria bacterium]